MKMGRLAVVPILAAVLLLGVTATHRMGITGDSIRYMSMARHIATGRGVAIYNKTTGGVSRPVVNFQPLWPAVLAAVSLVDKDLRTGTWILLCALLILNLFLAGFITFRMCRSTGAAVAAQLFLLLDLNWLSFHCYVLTEALFFALTSLVILCVWKYLNGGRRRWLVASCAVIAVASMERYVGSTYALGLFGALVLFGRGGIGRRIAVGLAAAAASLLPMGLWFLRHFLMTGEGFNRGVGGGHEVGSYYPLEMIRDVTSAFFAYPAGAGWVPEIAFVAIGLFVSVLAAGVYFFFRTGGAAEERPAFLLGAVILIMAFGYLAGVTALWTWRSMDYMPDPGRFLAPAYQQLWCFLVAALFFLHRRLPVVVCALLLILSVSRVGDWGKTAFASGDYGRKDIFTWEFVNRIPWFPEPPHR